MNQFDFKPFNAMTNELPAGMLLVLISSLMKRIVLQYSLYDNPLQGDALEVNAAVNALREAHKADAAARKLKFEQK